MNKRIFLNVMIVALLTFYMIFNIVYRQLIEKHESEPEQQSVVDIWQGPFMVPGSWQLTRLEMPSVVLQIDDKGQWSEINNKVDITTAAATALSWQNLAATQIDHYSQLPLEGAIILAFVAEDSQPLVFRMVECDESIYFYRMIDQKQFSYPVSSKALLFHE